MSDNEYTATMDELIDGYRAMRVQELAPVGPAFKRLLVSVEAVAEAHRALAAHDAEKDQQIAELRKRAEVAEAKIAATLAERLDHGAQGDGYAQLVTRMRAALTATGQEQSDA